MDYMDRFKCRISNDGVCNTVKYICSVSYNEIYEKLQNAYIDFKYSGRLLDGNHKTRYSHLGAHDIYHTDYSVLPLIFSKVNVISEDTLVDVGCGKGRVIIYWLSKGYKNEIIGLELDPEIAGQTSNQFKRYRNVKIVNGDAIDNLPDNGTIFYCYNPFSYDIVEKFEQKASSIANNNRVTIIYYNPRSIDAFKANKWKIQHLNFERDFGIKRWGRLNKYHDLAFISNDLAFISNN